MKKITGFGIELHVSAIAFQIVKEFKKLTKCFCKARGQTFQCNEKKVSDLKFSLFSVRSEAMKYSLGFLSQSTFTEPCT